MSDDQRTARSVRRSLVRLMLLWQLLVLLLFSSLYGAAVKDIDRLWIAAAVLAVVVLTLGLYLVFQMAQMLWRNQQRRRKHQQNGKLTMSFQESLLTRMIVDGWQRTVWSILRFTLRCVLAWTLLLLFFAALNAAIKLDVRLLAEAAPLVVGMGIGIGSFIAILIELFGRRLDIVEGISVSLNIPATATYAWPIQDIAGSQLVPVRASRVLIEIEFNTCRQRQSSIRFVTYATPLEVNDLQRVLVTSESSTGETVS